MMAALFVWCSCLAVAAWVAWTGLQARGWRMRWTRVSLGKERGFAVVFHRHFPGKGKFRLWVMVWDGLVRLDFSQEVVE